MRRSGRMHVGKRVCGYEWQGLHAAAIVGLSAGSNAVSASGGDRGRRGASFARRRAIRRERSLHYLHYARTVGRVRNRRTYNSLRPRADPLATGFYGLRPAVHRQIHFPYRLAARHARVMKVVLISTYEMGRQPFGLASPAAWLKRAGAEVCCCDVSRQPLNEAAVRAADLVAFYTPMHTATRLAARLAPRVRKLNPRAHLCFYGLYAPVNEEFLRGLGAGTILGGEFEPALVALAKRLEAGRAGPQEEPRISLDRLRFVPPDRSGLPPPREYARLVVPGQERRITGYTEASRGCKHLCRHCPIVPIYGGRFRVVDREVVLEDIRRQVAAGARHMTFGDPDFFNGPAHAIRIVEALHASHPTVTYDVTIKIEHLLRHADFLPRL